jgi:hypothetical protein
MGANLGMWGRSGATNRSPMFLNRSKFKKEKDDEYDFYSNLDQADVVRGTDNRNQRQRGGFVWG